MKSKAAELIRARLEDSAFIARLETGPRLARCSVDEDRDDTATEEVRDLLRDFDTLNEQSKKSAAIVANAVKNSEALSRHLKRL